MALYGYTLQRVLYLFVLKETTDKTMSYIKGTNIKSTQNIFPLIVIHLSHTEEMHSRNIMIHSNLTILEEIFQSS